MPRRPNLLFALLFVTTAGVAAAAARPFAAARTSDRPDTPPVGTTGDPDCTDAVPITLALGDSLTFTGETNGTGDADTYGCVGWDESGPETVFTLTPLAPLLLHVRVLAATADLDLFLLSSCSADSCLAWANSEFVVPLDPAHAPRYLVVDGYRGDAGPFTLQMATYTSVPTGAVCDSAATVACGEIATTVEGNLLDRTNPLVWNDCADYPAWGGEQWFTMTVLDSAEVSVTLSGQSFDGVLWLFDGCGSEAICLAHADAALAGGEERLTWQNLTGRRRTLWVGVDAARPLLSSEGDTQIDGQYQLQLTCTGGVVAVERSGWGALKRRYR